MPQTPLAQNDRLHPDNQWRGTISEQEQDHDPREGRMFTLNDARETRSANTPQGWAHFVELYGSSGHMYIHRDTFQRTIIRYLNACGYIVLKQDQVAVIVKMEESEVQRRFGEDTQ